MSPLFGHGLHYKTIDTAAERAILRVHHEHPEMGRKRLHAALAEQGVHVGEQALKHFLRAHGIGTAPAPGQVDLPYGVKHWPHIPWVKYRR